MCTLESSFQKIVAVVSGQNEQFHVQCSPVRSKSLSICNHMWRRYLSLTCLNTVEVLDQFDKGVCWYKDALGILVEGQKKPCTAALV